MKSLNIIIVSIILVLASSCSKEPGEGGTSNITGNVYFNLYDHNDKFIEKQNAVDEQVFITYGDHTIFDDDTDTHQDGQYQFKFLRNGDYKVFAYEDCDTCDSGIKPVEIAVEITENKSTVSVSDIELRKNIDPNDGNSTIKGKIFEENYNSSGQLNDDYYIGNERVFIKYDNDASYFGDVRTNTDGSYEFKNLIIGSYTVYAFSKCDKFDNANNYNSCAMAVEKTGTITQKGQTVELSDILIYQ
ncbi:MAG: hypothetical protein JKX95_04420 [Bacteroidia bacterium]|nr:hypothetical protein [Bacteroidia bacterium]